MKSGVNALIKLRSVLFPVSSHLFSLPKYPVQRTYAIPTFTTCSTYCVTEEESPREEDGNQPSDSTEILKRWGCNDNDLSMIFMRRPSLRNADLNSLQFKLKILSGLGISAPDLVKIINCRPRFLSCRINRCLDERLQFFMTIFGSKEVLVKALVRNPSLFTYDFHKTIKPAIALYEEMGLSREDLITMLLSRPTMIARTSFGDEKMEYIRKTKLSKDSKMYKYVVTLIGISRSETIGRKLANFEKFGFSEDEVFGLFGRSPFVLTLSVDKVQRNMTFIIGTMKLPAKVVLEHPFLLYTNLEAGLRPRILLAAKLQEMGLDLQIKGPELLKALRMKEKRFLEAFITCHPKEIADELMACYMNAKRVKRLAIESKKNSRDGFPF
ncbi:transcription termination factor MTERF9, chloroplastic [Ziziphus jujuba]|uniref:Transcription termination factor MTERF9, chloroplastic n=1 Tax=Ziziphus jujuba TaxID=326968 RepID=A0A6P4A873_ZIZJJ|nr:transcription termination factor MTERF9, chloroplastic [Ziziphus jujuba]